MRSKGLIATIVVLIAVIITLVAVVFLMQMPTIFSVNNIKNSFSDKEVDITEDVTTEIPTTEIAIETTEMLPKLSTSIETYTNSNNHVSIKYPQIVGLDGVEKQTKLNNKIKVNATSIVSLYPISTAIQFLDIDCEVKSLDEKYITILYTGEVVGKSVKEPKANSNSGNPNKTNTYNNNKNNDPYLDGFVDPLLGANQYINPFQANVSYESLAPADDTVIVYSYDSNDTEVINNNQGATVNQNYDNTNTADKGPTPIDILQPTASSGLSSSQVVSDHFSYNNPGGSVSGFTGTNIKNDASTIDQKIFYTNTIDLETGLDVRLTDYISDTNKLAKYIRSNDVIFDNIVTEDIKRVREYINKTVLSKLVENLNQADFRNEGVKSWPKIFSYKEDDTIYLSIRLSSKLGNYAIVKYEK